jgi:hypothetical protein
MRPAVRSASLQVIVYTLQCGSCGHWVSSLDQDRTASAMLAHLRYLHAEPA